VCAFLAEVGISQGRAGAAAEKVAVPANSLRALPDTVDDVMGALVEPGGNALRAVRAAEVKPGERLLILGAGTIGLLAALFARADGADVHLMGRSSGSLDFARSLGFSNVWTRETLPNHPWYGVIDASNSPQLPALAVELVEPAKRVVYIGLAPEPSLVDSRSIAFKDVTAVGILSGSPGLDGAIEAYAGGAVDPRPLVAATVALEDLADVLAGKRPTSAGGGPKIHAQI
jgi:threonine dehydrogenase-like Zn-dependent dehydrogenase